MDFGLPRQKESALPLSGDAQSDAIQANGLPTFQATQECKRYEPDNPEYYSDCEQRFAATIGFITFR